MEELHCVDLDSKSSYFFFGRISLSVSFSLSHGVMVVVGWVPYLSTALSSNPSIQPQKNTKNKIITKENKEKTDLTNK